MGSIKKRIRIGVVGCGTIAQIMHIPYLRELEDLYELKAVCDIPPKLVNKMGDFYNIKERYTDYRELLLKGEIDAVIVLTHINHSEIAIEAANKGYERGQVPLPSPGVGGVCLEKDPFLFIASAKKVKYIPKLASHARSISEAMVDFVAAEINSFLKTKKKNNNKVLILGAAFKGRPATSDIRGSTTIGLIARLNKFGIKNIHVHDPMVNGDEISRLGVKYTEDLRVAFTNADAVVVMNNNPIFEDLNLRQLLALANNTVLLFDTWGLYKEDEIKKIKGVEYKRL